MTLLPSFHWPRFLRRSTRSKRLRTLRLAAIVLDPFKLRCCDIKLLRSEKEARTLIPDSKFSNAYSEDFCVQAIEIAQDGDCELLAIDLPIQGDCQRNRPLLQFLRKIRTRLIDVDPNAHDG
jgi:hypothetical protein